MTNVGDTPSPPMPDGGRARAAQAPTQEIPRPSGDDRTMPVPSGGPTIPSEADRARSERTAQRAAAKAARRERSRRPRQTRRAKLRLTRVDPWSVTRTAFLLSIAFGIMCIVAVFLILSIVDASGLWDKVNSTVQQFTNRAPAHRFNIKDYVGMQRVLGITVLISIVDVVLITALATLGAFIYNMAAAMLGGLEVTLAEDLD